MDLMTKITALAKRRGFIFQSSEIYGGYQGFWDYGPVGVELKRILKTNGGRLWFMVERMLLELMLQLL